LGSEGRSFDDVAGADSAADSAAVASTRKKHRRVVRKGTEREAVFGVTNDELELISRGVQGAADPNSNDERLLRDVPPHWGRR